MKYYVTVKYDYGTHGETFTFGPDAQGFASIMRRRPFVMSAEITTDHDDIEANAREDRAQVYDFRFGRPEHERDYGGLW